MKNKNLLYPDLAAIAGALLLLLALFLPFASANDDYKEDLMSYPDSICSEEANMTNKDAVHISLTEFIKIDLAAVDAGISDVNVIANMVIIIAFGVFAAFTLLFSMFKKPIAILIFDVISFALMKLIKFDFKERGVIPSHSYDWGISYIICYIGIAIAAFGAVLLLIAKIKSKRSAKIPEQCIKGDFQ